MPETYRRVQLPQQKSKLNFEAARAKASERAVAAASTPTTGEPFSMRTPGGFPTQEPPEVKKSWMEKILSFTGGDKIARGAGLAIAQAGTQKTMNEIQTAEGQMQQKLIEAINKARTEGRDTTRLVAAFKTLAQGIKNTGDSANDLYTEGITSKQIVGDAIQLATTVGTVGSVPGMAKNVVTKPGIIAGAIQGAKTGAIAGGSVGGVSGFAQGLKQDKSVVDSIKQGALAGVGGAVTGGVLGGVIGGVSGKLSSRAANKVDSYLDNVTPKVNELTPTEYERLLNLGKIAPKTATSPAKYILSESEKAAALKYKTLIASKDPVKNTISVIEEISKKDDEVGSFLKENNGIFNGNQLKKHIISKLDDVSDVTIDEVRLANAKQDLAENFVKTLKKKDMYSLWQARKAFDRQIEKAFTGAPTLQNRIKTEFRNSIQEFISQKTPDTTYSTLMKDMTELFNIRDILNNKAAKEKTHSAISLWIKHNPGKAKIVGWGLGSTAAGVIGTSLLGD